MSVMRGSRASHQLLINIEQHMADQTCAGNYRTRVSYLGRFLIEPHVLDERKKVTIHVRPHCVH